MKLYHLPARTTHAQAHPPPGPIVAVGIGVRHRLPPRDEASRRHLTADPDPAKTRKEEPYHRNFTAWPKAPLQTHRPSILLLLLLLLFLLLLVLLPRQYPDIEFTASFFFSGFFGGVPGDASRVSGGESSRVLGGVLRSINPVFVSVTASRLRSLALDEGRLL